jgi:transposase
MALNSNFQVPLPDKGIIVAKTGRYPYVFHVLETYRNNKGQPTNKRKSIGKLDKDTGLLIPNNAYYEFYGESASPVDVRTPCDDGTVYEIGVPFLSHRILSSLGVREILENSLNAPDSARVSGIAAYMLAEGNVMSCLERFFKRAMPSLSMTGQEASRLFESIGSVERMRFFKEWAPRRTQTEYLAYDVTSHSTYAKGILDAEAGYNRDGDRLPQINMAMYLGQQSMLPVFYATYQGSIVDKSHLKFMMEHNEDFGIKGVCFVLDRGFVSAANVEFMHDKGYPFMMAVENRAKAVKETILRHRASVQSSCNYLDGFKMFGLAVKGEYHGAASTLHIYFNPELAADQTDDLYRKIASDEETLSRKNELTKAEIRKFSRCFSLAKRDNSGGLCWTRDFDAIDAIAKDLGYICILTNTTLTSKEIISIYKNRDIIEKSFDEIKNHIDMKRLRTHKQKTTEGKMFCAFISLIVRQYIRNILSKWMETNRLTVKDVIDELSTIRTIISQGAMRLLNPLTKKQREILSQFGVTIDDLNEYIRCGCK